MLSISRILVISILVTSTMFASTMDDSIIKFEKKKFSKNKKIILKDITINSKKEMPIEGWYGYVLDIKAEIKGKELFAKDRIFSNGEVIALDLYDINNGESLKELLQPSLGNKYYKKEKLIAGNHNAKDKIVVFSDPLCPFCVDYLPDVIKHVNKNPENIALYYYHFPLLRLHPAAHTLVKAMELAKEKDIKDVELKTYETDWEKYFTEKSRDTQKILDAFNEVFSTKITLEEINDEKIENKIFEDVSMAEDMMIQGTPTVFVNGEKDNSKLKYETLGK